MDSEFKKSMNSRDNRQSKKGWTRKKGKGRQMGEFLSKMQSRFHQAEVVFVRGASRDRN